MSKNNKILIAVSALVVAALLYVAFHNGGSVKQSETSNPALSGNAPGDFHGIPPEGIGGDPDLNRDKNRWVTPAGITEMSVSQIISLPHDMLSAMSKEDRRKWTRAASEQASANENRGVQVVGYLAHAKESGAEACNGKSEIYHDFHLWLTDSPGVDKREGIVVEVTPYWKEQFPAWKLTTFEKLASEQAKVRVSGWILWDEEHGDEVGKSRSSLWEIHPITKFEIFSNGKWEELTSPETP
ncbi:MAG: hypothetical protein ACHQM6_02430 [Candidatus Kapaibacterium sp.]